MREITKSTMSTGLAMSLFGMQQMMNLFRQQQAGGARPVSTSLDSVAQSMVDQCGDAIRETFRTTDKVQRGMIDLTFRMLLLNGGNSPDGASSVAGATREATNMFRRWMGGL